MVYENVAQGIQKCKAEREMLFGNPAHSKLHRFFISKAVLGAVTDHPCSA
jgi:hypothetical protein